MVIRLTSMGFHYHADRHEMAGAASGRPTASRRQQTSKMDPWSYSHERQRCPVAALEGPC